MNKWREALTRWSTASPNRRAIEDDSQALSWSEVSRFVEELSTVPIDWKRPLVIAGHRSNESVIAMVGTLVNDGTGMFLERSTIGTTLFRLKQELKVFSLFLHESDLIGFETLLQQLGCDIGQKIILDMFKPHSINGRPVLVTIPGEEPDEDYVGDCGWLIMTSGSTAKPKLVMIDRQDLWARAIGETRDFEITNSEVFLNLLPASHDVGFNQLLSWLNSGAELVIQSHPSTDLTKELLKTKSISGVSGTPLMWLGFLRATKESEKFLNVRYLTVSGGALSIDDLKKIQSHFPNAWIYRTYGQTETFRSLIDKNKPGGELVLTHGKPLEDVRIRVVAEGEKAVSAGEVGELRHAGVGTMLGYYPSPLKWREVNTGDYFKLEANGEFTFVGRRDDLIKRWEVRMHLSEVECVLREMSGVHQVTVISRPVADARQNELAAFIVMDESKTALTEEEAIHFCKKSLHASKIPDRIFLVESIPETASRKTDRQALQQAWGARDAAKKN